MVGVVVYLVGLGVILSLIFAFYNFRTVMNAFTLMSFFL